MYWIVAAIVTLTSPLLPLSIAAVIVVILMRFVNLTKNRTIFTVLGSLVGAAIGIGIQVFSQRLTTMGNAPEILSEQANILKAVSAAFPPSLWGAKAIALPNAQGLLYLLLFLGVSFAAFYCMLPYQSRCLQGCHCRYGINCTSEEANTQGISKASNTTRSHTMALFSKNGNFSGERHFLK